MVIQRVKKVIDAQALLKGGETVIVAVSGGADSLALLHILDELGMKLQLSAVYIDHGLRPDEIDHEKQTIRKYCRERSINYISASVNVAVYIRQKKCSPEEGARILRYEALERIRSESDASAIAVAHTADDQVEEFLIRMIRGSSLKGLSGMGFKKGRIIRPLLEESKRTLIDYLNSKKITFCLDSSNSDRKFLRNRVRLALLPELESEFNPAIRRTILQNMDILSRDEDYIDRAAGHAYQKSVSTSGKPLKLFLDTDLLHRYHLAIRRRIIEKCLWQMKIKAGYVQIMSLLRLSQEGENGDEIHLSDGVRASRSHKTLTLSRPLKKGQRRGSVTVKTWRSLAIPHPGKYLIEEIGKILIISVARINEVNSYEKSKLILDRKAASFPLLLRSPKEGERFKPYKASGKKKIMRYLCEKKIARLNRPGYPVLVSGSRIIALPGLEIADSVKVTGSTREVVIVELRNIDKIEEKSVSRQP